MDLCIRKFAGVNALDWNADEIIAPKALMSNPNMERFLIQCWEDNKNRSNVEQGKKWINHVPWGKLIWTTALSYLYFQSYLIVVNLNHFVCSHILQVRFQKYTGLNCLLASGLGGRRNVRKSCRTATELTIISLLVSAPEWKADNTSFMHCALFSEQLCWTWKRGVHDFDCIRCHPFRLIVNGIHTCAYTRLSTWGRSLVNSVAVGS